MFSQNLAVVNNLCIKEICSMHNKTHNLDGVDSCTSVQHMRMSHHHFQNGAKLALEMEPCMHGASTDAMRWHPGTSVGVAACLKWAPRRAMFVTASVWVKR